ncbi:MAG TPA: DUF445 domain-containing protein [Burkholderiaceae bacterium]
MDKETELKLAKRRALLLLLAAAAVFIVTAVAPKNVWVDGIKAVAEAAMIGALADWFAVVALFRRVPIPFVSRHTSIIPNNKDRIADNLAHFVRDKFLDPASLVALIQRHDPAAHIARWLREEDNTRVLGQYAVKLVRGMLDVTGDTRIQRFLAKAFDAALAKIDLSKSVAAILDTLTRDGRHQELLDEAIVHLIALLRQEDTRQYIAERIVDWLKSAHPLKEKLLPTGWIGEHGADMIADALDGVLVQVGDDPEHALRAKFDATVRGLTLRLQSDPEFLAKGEEIKHALRHHDALQRYIGELWGSLRGWLLADIDAPDSRVQEKAVAMGAWVGHELAEHPTLRASLNRHMEELARTLAPDFAGFLTRHISDTVRRWDAQDMSRQIELNIGKDLQYIRINGTLVGGAIGLLLYLITLGLNVLRAA